MDMSIVNMEELSATQLMEAAQILAEGIPLGWPGTGDAQREIVERLVPENLLLAAMEKGHVLGWGGILPSYGGNVYELHPLVVRADMRGAGIGSLLVSALEQAAVLFGGKTMVVGADDEKTPGETSLAGKDLYGDIPGFLRDFQPGSHQSAFYMKLGYTVVGVLPDADGEGKPDIFLAKRL